MLLLFFSNKKKEKEKEKEKKRKKERGCYYSSHGVIVKLHSKVTKLVTHNIIFHSHVINSKITSDFMPIIIIDIIVLISPPQF